jgi:hypothetical protein
MEPPGARDSVPDAPPGWNDADSGGLLSEEMTREIGAKVTREIGQNIATNVCVCVGPCACACVDA